MKKEIVLLLLGWTLLSADVFQGTSSDDTITGTSGMDFISLLDGNDTGFGAGGNDTIFGGAGADILLGGDGNDILVGALPTSLADTGANDFTGGMGDDFLWGSFQSDTYRYNIGDGLDTIREPGTSPGAVDKLIFGPGITSGSIGFSRDKGDLFVDLSGGDIIRIESWFGASDERFQIEEFHFDPDPVIDGSTLPFDGTTWTGTSAADSYTAAGSANFWIRGLAANDTLNGSTGMDVITGGDGNDTLRGLDGNDGLYGENGNDQLYGGNGDDTLYGGEGNDTLYGEAGNNVLIGGPGADTFYGSFGNDIYKWNLGDGDDVISDHTGSSFPGEVNRLVFGAGILPSDVTTEALTSSSQHIKFVIRQNGVVVGSVTIYNWSFSQTPGRHSDRWRIGFADGAEWDSRYTGTGIADTLNGTTAADTLSGGNGNDTINGLDGDDVLSGDQGNDTLSGGNGDDTLDGGDGNDNLSGEAGNDLLIGGPGDDILNGAHGDDIYKWNLGDGNDTIFDYTGASYPEEVNRLVFGPGILPSDVTTEAVYTTYQTRLKFVIRQNGVVNGSVTINYWQDAQTPGRHHYRWRIGFVNGTEWDGRYLATPLGDYLNGTASADTLSGGAGNDTINGLDGDDVLSGDQGNDTLSGGNGDDMLTGGDGNDYLNGEAGNDLLIGGPGDDILNGAHGDDIYKWNLGDGNDTIFDYTGASYPEEVNRLVFGPGILPSDVTTEAVYTPYQIHHKFVIRQNGVVNGSVTINYWQNVQAPGRHCDRWRIGFADGGEYYREFLPTGADDILYGTDANDTFFGYGGNDRLYGGAGNDTLIGGLGDDWLYGGIGNDEYRFARGDGRNVISETYESGSNNVIVLGSGITTSDIGVVRVGNSVVLVDLQSSLTIEISKWFSDPAEPISRVFFADQTEWSAAYITSIATTDGDLNGDAISDANAYQAGLSVTDEDPDGDGIPTATELLLGLNPLLADSDGDGVDDSLDYGSSVPNNDPLVITIDSPLSAILTN